MPPEYINHLKNEPIPHSNDYNFISDDFCEGAAIAYNTVFDAYNHKFDFLNHSFASPSLSLAINDLIAKKKDIILSKPICKDIRILGHWLQEDHTCANDKLLGLWNEKEIEHSIMVGVIGPEIGHIWSQNPIQQIVKIHYVCENREDIWLFERCLFDQEPQWQIRNINGIIHI